MITEQSCFFFFPTISCGLLLVSGIFIILVIICLASLVCCARSKGAYSITELPATPGRWAVLAKQVRKSGS